MPLEDNLEDYWVDIRPGREDLKDRGIRLTPRSRYCMGWFFL